MIANLSIQHMQPQDEDRLMDFRDYVLRRLDHPDHYVRETDERQFVRNHLGQDGVTIGIFHHTKLVAYSALSLHLERTHQLPYYRSLLAECLHPQRIDTWGALAATMVDPAWRGHGLQRLAISWRIAYAKRFGLHRLAVMVSPYNQASLHNLMDSGFTIHSLQATPDGCQRHLLTKDLVWSNLRLKSGVSTHLARHHVLRRPMHHELSPSEQHYSMRSLLCRG